MKITLGKRIARRKRTLYGFIIITLFAILVLPITFIYKISWLKEITTMVIGAFVSTILAISITKDDILENDYAEKRDEFGVLTFEEGYREVFRNGDCITYLKSNNWLQFFQLSSDKKIYFVGISFYNFFDDPKMRENLYDLCDKSGFSIYIILANPLDREISRVNTIEGKAGKDELKQRIMKTYTLFDNDLRKMGERAAKIREKLFIKFSIAFPTMLLIKAGKYMIISPYILENPDRAPTIIAEDSKSQSFFEKYNEYLNAIEKNCILYENLRGNVTSKEFFTQSYTNFSQEFLEDIKHSKYMAVIGLSQSRMLRTLGSIYTSILKSGAKIDIILTDPDGQSTPMCTKRSSGNREDIEGDISVHKETINRLIDMKQYGDIRIYISDFMYPYTMYAFNCKNGVNNNTKMYIWQTTLFEASDKRPGFVLKGEEDFERMKSYYYQFCVLKDKCDLTRELRKKYDLTKANCKKTLIWRKE